MLDCKINAAKVLEVKETLMGWHGSKVTYWYYDTQNWLRSRLGKKGETPSEPMRKENIAWVQKYYLPKAQLVEQF